MNPIVRKAFAKVNRFMKGIEPQVKDEGVPGAAYEVLTKLNDEEKKAMINLKRKMIQRQMQREKTLMELVVPVSMHSEG